MNEIMQKLNSKSHSLNKVYNINEMSPYTEVKSQKNDLAH